MIDEELKNFTEDELKFFERVKAGDISLNQALNIVLAKVKSDEDETLNKNLVSAILSNELEGSYCTEEEKEIYERVKKGELSLGEATNLIVENINNEQDEEFKKDLDKISNIARKIDNNFNLPQTNQHGEVQKDYDELEMIYDSLNDIDKRLKGNFEAMYENAGRLW